MNRTVCFMIAALVVAKLREILKRRAAPRTGSLFCQSSVRQGKSDREAKPLRNIVEAGQLRTTEVAFMLVSCRMN
jgi:hypothetical protein